MAGRRVAAAAVRTRRPSWLLVPVLSLALDAAALPTAEPADVVPTPLRVFSLQPLAGGPERESAAALSKRPAPVSPFVDVEGDEMGLIMHQQAVADSQGLLSEWMADAQFATPAAAAASGSSDDVLAGAGQRSSRRSAWQRQPAWMANSHDADAAVSNAMNAVQRDWVAPRPGSGGLGLSSLPGLGGYLMPEDSRHGPVRGADVDPPAPPPLVSLPAEVRAFVRDNYALILATAALVVGVAAAAKAYSRRI